MSSLELDTQSTAASGPVISVSAESVTLDETPMPGLMPPPRTCDDAAEVEPIVPRLDASIAALVDLHRISHFQHAGNLRTGLGRLRQVEIELGPARAL